MDYSISETLSALFNISSMKEAKLFSRLHYFSAYFLDKPYQLNPQGENDIDAEFPLYRFDVFDCLTYVNNVLALAISQHPRDFIGNLIKINYYNAIPTFENRFHFMSCDWNIENQRHCILEDITTRITKKALIATGNIDKANWYRKQNKIAPMNASIVSSSIAFIPLDIALNEEVLSQIPTGSIIEIVRPNWDLRDKIGTQLHVSHVGFVFEDDNKCLRFRHASSIANKVVDVDFVEYLLFCKTIETIKGINVQVILNL